MRIKDLELTAISAWSPKEPYLAAGTAAQQLDETFSTASNLEIYSLDFKDESLSMPKAASIPVQSRFFDLIWGSSGDADKKGWIVGGQDQGLMTIYDADKLLARDADPLLFSSNKHTGSVASLDFNPFQNNLLASGASESEIFIWDLNKLESPMTPGSSKSQPLDDVRCVAWNRQVQHILASCFSSRCVVWDLRKNDPIIKVSDSSSRNMRGKVVAWHPNVATQLCLASEDDHYPVIQVWDLRLASSPLRTLEYHQRGALSLSWCSQDPDLLLSCGKDESIFCGNPNSDVSGGELLSQISSGPSWNFKVAFCPFNPCVLSASSFDGRVTLYSLMGSEQQLPAKTSSSLIADSFPGMDTTMAPQPAQTPAPSTGLSHLKKSPKWLKRPCGASFGFGGRLVTFGIDSVKSQSLQQHSGTGVSAPVISSVQIYSVVTEPELVERSMQLETSLTNQNFIEFCSLKIEASTEEEDQKLWKFIRANFEACPREIFLDLLGYDYASSDMEPLVEEFQKSSMANGEGENDVFDTIQSHQTPIVIDSKGEDGILSKALLGGNIEAAVQICLKKDRMADALVLAMQGGEELFYKTKLKYFEKSQSKEADLIKAVTTGEWEKFMSRVDVESSWKEALVSAVTYSPTQEEFSAYCTSLGNRLKGDPALICYICAGSLDDIVRAWIESRDTQSAPDKLQDLVEVVMTLKKACERLNGREPTIQGDGPLAEKMTHYAGLLASQGALQAASTYVDFGAGDQLKDSSLYVLKERIRGALGLNSRNRTTQIKGQQRFGKQSNMYSNPYPQNNNNYGYASGLGSSLGGPPMNEYNLAPKPTVNMFSPSQPVSQAPLTMFTPSSVPSSVPGPFSHGTSANGPSPNILNPSLAPSIPTNSNPYVPDQGGVGHAPPSSNGSGWNDPPLLMARSKSNSITRTTPSVDPITQPLYQVPGEPTPPVNSSMPPSGYYEPTPYYQPTENTGYPNVMTPQPAVNPPLSASIPNKSAPPEPVAKPPIPAEHQVLQDVFEGLRQKCLVAANHPHMKRKLDDVGKKLEILYDKLRENSLPDSTLTGLHQLSTKIMGHDYDTCLKILYELVSTGSFSALSQFLVGVKTLIQVASQHAIYLR